MTAQGTSSWVSGAATGKHLTFRLGRESYGIPVLKVREIIRLVPITSVPQMPPHFRGVINLRGKIIPVADLRVRFGLEAADDAESTCIVVVRIRRGCEPGPSLQMGLVVDAVEEVVNIVATEVEPTPDFGVQVEAAYLVGMAKIKGTVKALLDIDRVLGGEVLEVKAEPGLEGV